MTGTPGTWAVVRAVAVRPGLWPIAVVMGLRLAAPGWWRRWPPVPWPDPEYARLRMTVAYGGDGTRPPEPEDVVAYLRWCRRSWLRSRRGLG